ncbi:hypothetical protein BC835DRAFT_219145 [Cytidiella melzeri]|nr:hypothetical protein BC835DRAFT_219145 [Cytidiella melzeri]
MEAGWQATRLSTLIVRTEAQIGSTEDPLSARPSEIFSRLADALFFWMDSNCDIAGLRSTGVIEPEKYAWMTLVTGTDLETAKLLVHYIQSFYESAGIPCQYRMGPNGRTVRPSTHLFCYSSRFLFCFALHPHCVCECYAKLVLVEQIAVLDRRGWLHASVFEARADPEESWKYWSKSITLLTLIDPLTSRPFPSPLPRSALPTHPVPSLRAIYTSWQIQTVADVQRQRSAEAVQQAMANARTQAAQAQMYQNSYVGAAAAAGLGATPGFGSSVSGVSGIGGGGGGSGLGGGEGGEHASLKDTITSVASLANTALNIFGGGGGGGGGLGLGNVVLGLGGIGAFNGFGN